MMNQYYYNLPCIDYNYTPLWIINPQYSPSFYNNVQNTLSSESCLPFHIQPRQNVILFSRSQEAQPDNLKVSKKSRKKSLNQLSSQDSIKNIKVTECSKKKATKADQADQKQGRNAISNLLRTFFRRLHFRITQDPKSFQLIIQRHNLKVTTVEFLTWYQNNKADFRNYIRLASVKKVFVSLEVQQHEFNKIMRVLLEEFMRKEAVNCFLTSRKTKRDAMIHNIAAIRHVRDEIMESGCQQIE